MLPTQLTFRAPSPDIQSTFRIHLERRQSVLKRQSESGGGGAAWPTFIWEHVSSSGLENYYTNVPIVPFFLCTRFFKNTCSRTQLESSMSRRSRGKQILRRNVQHFRGGLVFKAHRRCVSLNSRLESNQVEEDVLGTRDHVRPRSNRIRQSRPDIRQSRLDKTVKAKKDSQG